MSPRGPRLPEQPASRQNAPTGLLRLWGLAVAASPVQQQGNSAGREHYCRAGEMLIEAKEQVALGGWPRWLMKNFELSRVTANRYMRMHRDAADHGVIHTSIRAMIGNTTRDREERQSKQQQEFRRVMREVARDDFVQERQDRQDDRTANLDAGPTCGRGVARRKRRSLSCLRLDIRGPVAVAAARPAVVAVSDKAAVSALSWSWLCALTC
jgi:hypothetical protein